MWEDFDADLYGDAWTLMEYEAFAEGFRWGCCKSRIIGIGSGQGKRGSRLEGKLGGRGGRGTAARRVGCTVARRHEA